jgi:hypothetical protein
MRASLIASQMLVGVRPWAVRRNALSLGCLDGSTNGRPLVGGQIVHDDDIAGAERWSGHLLEVSDHIRSPTRTPSDSLRSDFALATSCNQTQCSAAEAIGLAAHFFRRRTAHCILFGCQDCAAVEHQAGARPRATQAAAAMQFRRKIYPANAAELTKLSAAETEIAGITLTSKDTASAPHDPTASASPSTADPLLTLTSLGKRGQLQS